MSGVAFELVHEGALELNRRHLHPIEIVQHFGYESWWRAQALESSMKQIVIGL